MKKIIIGIHDFGKPKTKEFDYFATWLKNFSDYEFTTFEMYNEEYDRANYLFWVAKAKKYVQSYIDDGYEVVLCGISMGGVIAAFLAAIMPVKKLVMIAPSYLYLDIEASYRLVKKAITLLDDETKFDNYLNERIISSEYFEQYMEMVDKLKQSLPLIKCPTLILHGTEDEYVPLSSSRYAYASLTCEKKHLIFIENGTHSLLLDSEKQTAVNIIKIFLEDWI